MIDLHVHAGQWDIFYFPPHEVIEDLLSFPLTLIGFSSTSACKHPYILNELLDEARILFSKWPDNIFHWLWVHPEHLSDIEKLLDSSSTVPIHGLKVHPYAQHFTYNQMKMVYSMADSKNLPLLVHTGGRSESEPLIHDPFLAAYPNVQVVLAHARPLDQSLYLGDRYQNAWFDTSFLPPESWQKIKTKPCAKRFVWGSDYPISGPLQGRAYSDIIKDWKFCMPKLQENTTNYLQKIGWMKVQKEFYSC